MARANNHLTFLIRCRNHGIIPKCLRVRLPLQSTKANILKARTERTLTRIAITEARRTRKGLLPLVERLKEELQRDTDTDDFSYAVRLVDQEKAKMFNETKTRQMRKFEALLNSKNWQERRR